MDRKDFNKNITKLNKQFIDENDINILLSYMLDDCKNSSLVSFDIKKVGQNLKNTVKEVGKNIGNLTMNPTKKEITSNNFEKFRLDIGQGIGSIKLAIQQQLTWFDYKTNDSIKNAINNIQKQLKMDEICKATLFFYYTNNPNFKELVDRSRKETSTTGFEKLSDDNLIYIYNRMKGILTAFDTPEKSSVKDTRNSGKGGVLVTKTEDSKKEIYCRYLYLLLLREYYGEKEIPDIDVTELLKGDRKDRKVAIIIKDIEKKYSTTNIKQSLDEILNINNASDQLIRLFFNEYNKKYYKYLLPNLTDYSTTNLAEIKSKFEKENPPVNKTDKFTKKYKYDDFVKVILQIFRVEQNLIDLYNKTLSDRSNEINFLNVVFNACTNNDNSPLSIANRLVEEIKLNTNNNINNFNTKYVLVCTNYKPSTSTLSSIINVQPYNDEFKDNTGKVITSYKHKKPCDINKLLNPVSDVSIKNSPDKKEEGTISIYLVKDKITYIFKFDNKNNNKIKTYITTTDFYKVYSASSYGDLKHNIETYIKS